MRDHKGHQVESFEDYTKLRIKKDEVLSSIQKRLNENTERREQAIKDHHDACSSINNEYFNL